MCMISKSYFVSIDKSDDKIVLNNLPTSDPKNTGQLWNDNGTLKISYRIFL